MVYEYDGWYHAKLTPPAMSYDLGNGYSSSSPTIVVTRKHHILGDEIFATLICSNDNSEDIKWVARDTGELLDDVLFWQPLPYRLYNFQDKYNEMLRDFEESNHNFQLD